MEPLESSYTVRILSYLAEYLTFNVLIITLVFGLLLLRNVIKLTTNMCEDFSDVSDKTVIVTGASAGIGKETARELAKRNARVILACRSLSRGQAAADDIVASTGSRKVVVKQLDLSSFRSIREFAKNVFQSEPRLNILINNAAFVCESGKRELTEDGLEVQFTINYFGHFLLTLLLLPLMKNSASSRIILVSSDFYKRGRIDFTNLNSEVYLENRLSLYCNTKLAIVLFGQELSRLLNGSGVTVNTCTPGVTCTNIYQRIPWPIRMTVGYFFSYFLKSPREGAQTLVFLAVSKDLSSVSGLYFKDCKPVPLEPVGTDLVTSQKLFKISEKLTHEELK